MLWAMVGQTLNDMLAALRSTSASTSSQNVCVPAGELVVISSLRRVLDAMKVFKDSSPLIGTHSSPALLYHTDGWFTAAELSRLRTIATNNQACT